MVVERLFEGATPLIDRLSHEGPFRSPATLFARAEVILADLTEAEQIAVINAHPRIGEAPDRLRAQSEAAFREQGYDPGGGADPTAPAVLAELARLNAEYERRFGFRFLVFVNQRSKAALLPVLRERLNRPRAVELATALSELLAIARDRLQRSGDGP